MMDDDKQWERSFKLAEQFLDQDLLPQLYEFDLDSEDEDYIKGTAIYKLFLEMAFALQQLGWESTEIKKEIDNYIIDLGDKTIH